MRLKDHTLLTELKRFRGNSAGNGDCGQDSVRLVLAEEGTCVANSIVWLPPSS